MGYFAENFEGVLQGLFTHKSDTEKYKRMKPSIHIPQTLKYNDIPFSKFKEMVEKEKFVQFSKWYTDIALSNEFANPSNEEKELLDSKFAKYNICELLIDDDDYYVYRAGKIYKGSWFVVLPKEISYEEYINIK